MNIKVGSRVSKLALRQTEIVIDLLQEVVDETFEIVGKVTKGDKNLDITLSKIGGKGLFIKELEYALLNHEVDFVVHSLKDMPTNLHDDLIIAAIPVREDSADTFISTKYETISDLPVHAKIGTSSIRRAQQLLAVRPDIIIESIRGNILTRIDRMTERNLDGIILAAAGLERLGMLEKPPMGLNIEILPKDHFIPAVGQGALALECRKDDTKMQQLLTRIHDKKTAIAVEMERSFLREMNGSCSIPIAGNVEITESDDKMIYHFQAMYSDGIGPLKFHSISGMDGTLLVQEMVKKMKD